MTESFLSSGMSGYSIKNIPIIVIPVHTPMVFSDSRVRQPLLTSEAMSNIFSVASKPGRGRIFNEPNPSEDDKIHHTEESSEHGGYNAINVSLKAPSSNVIRGPSASEYCAFDANKKIAGNVKMNPVEACVAPVVAEVAMLTSEGDHFSAIPNR